VPEILVGGQPRGEELQRDQPVEPVVAGPEHHGHPARADLFLQAVPGDPRARGIRGAAGLSGPRIAHGSSGARAPEHYGIRSN
jgi:hypothetical protein